MSQRLDAGGTPPAPVNPFEAGSPREALQQALTVIAGWAELLVDDTELPQDARHAARVIRTRAKDAVRLLQSGI